MDKKYKQLIVNTVIFGIGAFSSKALVFLLMPLYTYALNPGEFGIVDIIVQTSNLIIPLASLGITGAVLRFGLDSSNNKDEVFTVGLITILGGFAVFLILTPLMWLSDFISPYIWLIVLFVLTSNLRALCSQFTRAKQMMKLYSLDGVISTATTILFTIIFLLPLKMGITGYVLAIILSDSLSAIFLFFTASLHKNCAFKRKFALLRPMLAYALPLIPTTIFWWITNVSDRYMVTYMLGQEANGLYAISYKIPTFLILISGIFMEAWQVSAVTDNAEERSGFFSRVFSRYQTLIFIAAALIIPSAKLIISVLVDASFYASWKYVPFLVLSTTFSCLVTFFGTIYMVEKKSMHSMLTTVIGAVINIALNLLLIKSFGPNGAAFSTFMSYLIVFVIRSKNTGKFLKFDWDVQKICLNTFLLTLQSIIMITEVEHWLILEIALVVIMALQNIGSFLSPKILLKHNM
ncbi:MAG: oligosaccharide flippase family protein [Clostridiales bacterium]|nr:oligosaccharide flippase family protein [Clostridiales bacterium]